MSDSCGSVAHLGTPKAWPGPCRSELLASGKPFSSVGPGLPQPVQDPPSANHSRQSGAALGRPHRGHCDLAHSPACCSSLRQLSSPGGRRRGGLQDPSKPSGCPALPALTAEAREQGEADSPGCRPGRSSLGSREWGLRLDRALGVSSPVGMAPGKGLAPLLARPPRRWVGLTIPFYRCQHHVPGRGRVGMKSPDWDVRRGWHWGGKKPGHMPVCKFLPSQLRPLVCRED